MGRIVNVAYGCEGLLGGGGTEFGNICKPISMIMQSSIVKFHKYNFYIIFWPMKNLQLGPCSL